MVKAPKTKPQISCGISKTKKLKAPKSTKVRSTKGLKECDFAFAMALTDHALGKISDKEMEKEWNKGLDKEPACKGACSFSVEPKVPEATPKSVAPKAPKLRQTNTIPKVWHDYVYAPNPWVYLRPGESFAQRKERIHKDSLDIGVTPETIANWDKTVSELFMTGLLKTDTPGFLQGYKTLWELGITPMEFPVNIQVRYVRSSQPRMVNGYKCSY